ncbi:hypothetical protein EDC19_1137 [Natranaerovirga hydrolytica]|uniref:Uncharacterized protein n=1 Tax=Natranaerovirga hydrolytica TaxID=680378 RepID=A0A4R1N3R1_9FIRM|nr:hypothetical protein [Natranaerovirga hydrolytica]TCK98704.1 hypothetical protein EDC19_1137 [Natranaerovirga hydrolytica]
MNLKKDTLIFSSVMTQFKNKAIEKIGTNLRKSLLKLYGIIILFLGILYVPLIAYGTNDEIRHMTYAPIWRLKTNIVINNQPLYYTLDSNRIIITFIAITLITSALYLSISRE